MEREEEEREGRGEGERERKECHTKQVGERIAIGRRETNDLQLSTVAPHHLNRPMSSEWKSIQSKK